MHQRFTPYGTLLARDSAGSSMPKGLHVGWTGREYGAETGFTFHRARYYSPDLRRWTQEDPIGYNGGRNLFAYVGGRVLELRDPTGLYSVCITVYHHTWNYNPETGANQDYKVRIIGRFCTEVGGRDMEPGSDGGGGESDDHETPMGDACPRVTVEGSKIQIDALVIFDGGTTAEQRMILRGITNFWARRISGFEIKINFADPTAPPLLIGVKRIGERGQYSGGGRSWGPELGSEIQMEVAEGVYLEDLAAHEFGHALGLEHVNNDFNRMYPKTTSRSRAISADQIAKVIHRCAKKQAQ